jgi:hypothetical protein
MSPQDPEAVTTREAPVVSQGMGDAHTLPRMEPVTRFFSADELLSRGEKVNPHGFGSGEFETVKQRLGSSPHAAAVPAWPDGRRGGPIQRNTLPIGTAAGATSEPPPPPKAPSPTARSASDEPVNLPYVWGPKLGTGAISLRHVVMALLAAALPVVFLAGPVLRARFAPHAPTTHTAAKNPKSTEAAAPAAPVTAAAAPSAPSPSPRSAGPVTSPTDMTSTVTTSPLRGQAAGHGPTPERAAIDAVAEGRYAVALDLYRKLMSEDPSRQSYRDAVRILTARLTAPQ